MKNTEEAQALMKRSFEDWFNQNEEMIVELQSNPTNENVEKLRESIAAHLKVFIATDEDMINYITEPYVNVPTNITIN